MELSDKDRERILEGIKISLNSILEDIGETSRKYNSLDEAIYGGLPEDVKKMIKDFEISNGSIKTKELVAEVISQLKDDDIANNFSMALLGLDLEGFKEAVDYLAKRSKYNELLTELSERIKKPKSEIILSMNYDKCVDDRIIDVTTILEKVVEKENEE